DSAERERSGALFSGDAMQDDQLVRSIVDALPALVAYVRADLTYQMVSRGYEEWFGTPADQLVGHTLEEVLGPDAFATLRPHVEMALRGRKVSYEARLAYRSGPRWVRASYLPDVAPEGNVRGFVALVLDIEEQKRTEQRLADEAHSKDTLARLASTLVADLDLDAIFKRLTEEATALCRAQFGAFFYNVEQAGRESYMLYTIAGAPREAFSKFPMPRNTAIFAPTFRGEGVVRSDDITLDPRYGHSAPYHGMPEGHLPVHSYLAVPVVSRTGHVHGGLFFGHREIGVFDERDELILSGVAAQAAAAIDNAQLHAATLAAEQRYRALSESMPLLVWAADTSGQLEYVNARFLQYTGRSLEELRQRAPESAMHPDDLPLFESTWQRALASGSPLEMEYRLRRADGAFRWFLARGVPVLEHGSIRRWVGSCTDIEDQKRSAERQRFLAEAGALLSSSFDYPSTLSAVAHLAVPLLADACVFEVLGDSELSETLAASSTDAVHVMHTRLFRLRGEWRSHADLVRDVRVNGLRVCASDADGTRAVQTAGGEEPLDWLIVPVVAQQRVLGTVTLLSFGDTPRFDPLDIQVAEDLGRRTGSLVENSRLYELARREQKRAEDASRAKDLFLGTLSHELRTPLSAILGWTRMLQSGSLAPDKRERALETIERNARVQVAMIEDVLDVARITSGKLRLDVVPVEVAQVVDAAIETIRPTADAKGVRIQAVLDPDAGVLHGDGPRLQQITWNLLSNAVKFTPKGGRVYVVLRRVDSSIEIAVSDTGSGISSDFLPHVFERFTQADPTRTRQHGGLGLGLSIVKHLTELHGGTVAAESGGPSQGATFTVRLPVAPLRDTPISGPRTLPTAPDLPLRPELDGLRVLIVDDEPDARELLQSVLETCKARVSIAASAREAFQKLQDELPEVLISDIGMPEEDGYSLIRKVRGLPAAAGGATPAVALTAYASLADRTRALMEGFNNHVSKPAEPAELIAVVAAVAGRHRRA
ncbi:MAG TPA: PAS domain-containing protein, partial [Polyangiales bacterium]